MAYNKIVLNGSGSHGKLDSTIGLTTGQTFSVIFMSTSIPNVTEHFIASDTAGTNGIILRRVTDGYAYQIRYSGTDYDSGVNSVGLYDGEEHTIDVTRSGSDFIFTIDGTVEATITVTANVFNIDKIGIDPVSGDTVPCFLENLTIGTHTYFPIKYDEPNSKVEDTSGGGNNLALSFPTLASLSTWEWIGDFVHIYKVYRPSGGGLAYERRKEGIRKRVVCGFSMSDSAIKQAGQEVAAGVTAYNRTQATTLTPDDAGGSSVDCDEEIFTPLAGTGIFEQKQKWVSWSTDSF